MGCNMSVDVKGENYFTVTFVGLDNAGKSHIVHKLVNTEGQDYKSLSTAGCDYKELNMGSTYIRIYDCGGLGKYRELWSTYIRQSDGVVFVIDKSDHVRMSRVREEIQDVMQLCNSLNLPLLILANKTDKDKQLRIDDIASITQAPQARITYSIKECCAVTGEGLNAGRDWIMQSMEKSHEAVMKK